MRVCVCEDGYRNACVCKSEMRKCELRYCRPDAIPGIVVSLIEMVAVVDRDGSVGQSVTAAQQREGRLGRGQSVTAVQWTEGAMEWMHSGTVDGGVFFCWVGNT